MNRSLTSAVGAVFSARVLLLVAGVIITPFLTRLLGPSQYGQYATIMAIFGLTKIIMVSGVMTGSKKYLSEERSIENWKDNVWGSYFQLSLLIAGLAFLVFIGATLSGVVPSILGKDYVPLFYLLSIYAFVNQFRTLSASSLMGLHLEMYSEPIKVTEKILFGLTAVYLAYIGYNVEGVIVGHIVSVTISLIICLVLLKRHINVTSFVNDIPHHFPRKELWRFNHKSATHIFLLSSLYHVDVIVLKIFTIEETVGHYKAALVILGLLWVLPKSIQNVLIQSVSEMWRTNQTSQIEALAAKTTRYVALITVLLAIGIGVLADTFIPLYFGSEYDAAVEPLLILLPGVICFAVARPALAITNAKGKMRPLLIATGVSAGINLLLNLLLIPNYGLVGAATATTLGYGSLLLTQISSAKYIGYNPISGVKPFRIILTGLLTGIGIFAVSVVLTDPIVTLIMVPPIGGFLFLFLSLATGALSLQELLKISGGL